MTGSTHDRPTQDEEFDVGALVAAAREGDGEAWRAIVQRYSPLLAHVVRSFRLGSATEEDVAQAVWVRLIEKLDTLREPRALPGWIMTTAKREAMRVATSDRRLDPRDPTESGWDHLVPSTPDGEAAALRAEAQQVLLAGLAELSDRDRTLLTLLVAEPPLSYAEISARMSIPIGSIGPTRARALERLRRTAALRGYPHDEDHQDRRTATAPAQRIDLTGGERHDASRMG